MKVATAVTVPRLVKWVLENRRDRAFHGWTLEQIGCNILYGIEHRCMFYSTDSEGMLNGIAVSSRDDSKREIYVHAMLTTQPRVMRDFVLAFAKHFPGYSLVATRHDRPHTFNLKRLIPKLLKGAQH